MLVSLFCFVDILITGKQQATVGWNTKFLLKE